MSPLLEVRDMRRSFGAIQAVDGVSFAVRQGEILGIVGPNGSGKTTLFNCILGQIRPHSGEVRLDGVAVSGLSPARLSRLGIGRTFQMLQVFGGMKVRDNLIVAAQEHTGSLASRLFSPPDAGFGARADEMLDFFKLRHLADQPAGDCSFGQQKLLDIAMALMAGPRLVLLDEPAGGVNPATLADLHDMLGRLNQEKGASFVVIEHNMDFVMSLCDRILVLVEGRVLAEGAPGEIQKNPAVIEAYLGN